MVEALQMFNPLPKNRISFSCYGCAKSACGGCGQLGHSIYYCQTGSGCMYQDDVCVSCRSKSGSGQHHSGGSGQHHSGGSGHHHSVSVPVVNPPIGLAQVHYVGGFTQVHHVFAQGPHVFAQGPHVVAQVHHVGAQVPHVGVDSMGNPVFGIPGPLFL